MSLKAKILYNEQQPTKTNKIAIYSNSLTALNISPHLIANTQSKQIVEASSSQKGHKKEKRTKRQTKKDNGIYGFSSPEVKKVDQFYLNGTASHGIINQLQIESKLLLDNAFSYFERKPSFIEYRSIRLNFLFNLNSVRLKAFVKDTNEILSLDLAHVD